MAETNHNDDSQRPDLDDTTNVAKAHAELFEASAAAAREKQVRENGMEPVSLWIFLVTGFVLLVGGAVLGTGGNLFNYSPFPSNYVQLEPPGGGDTGPVTGPIVKALSQNGGKVYGRCIGCHQPDGNGQPGAFPPLAGSEWVTGDTQALAMIIMNGLKGPIEVKGQTWNLNMAAQMPLDAVELASVMTYIRNSFGNDSGDVVTPGMAAAALEVYKERAAGSSTPPQMTAEELKAEHAKMLPGEKMDPQTIVNFETLEPVGGAAE
ncbi:MAG: c-type cytochrome [Akkermansiaceae bacterium]|nr:c-type cytochrome [Akkermansiaceae bacterium]